MPELAAYLRGARVLLASMMKLMYCSIHRPVCVVCIFLWGVLIMCARYCTSQAVIRADHPPAVVGCACDFAGVSVHGFVYFRMCPAYV